MDARKKFKQLNQRIYAAWLAIKDKRTPWYARIPAFLALAYFLSPIDLVPDFIPVLGQLDDLLVVPALLALTFRLLPKDVLSSCREAAQNAQSAGKVHWYYALPVVLCWLLLAGILAVLVVPAFLKK